ncbi:MAG: putative selenium-dependent hydroxylase accessory protein YqeC [Tissierellia bacterium]|nr:putative selenium-dependent hydroxylase accessory protein YqeC [Tissierellia bacterium]
MYLYKKLNLNTKMGEVISLVGGGGKTTTLYTLANELKEIGHKVLVTTTTAIYSPEGGYDYYFLKDLENDYNPIEGSITVLGSRIKNGKLLGLSLDKMADIIDRKLFDFILIEADGAKGKPIKAPASYEPVVPEKTCKTIGIIGLDALDKRIEDIAHRPEIFIRITDKQLTDRVDEDAIIRCVLHEKGLFKGAYGERVLILNKAFNDGLILRGNRIREKLYQEGFKGSILVTNIKSKQIY